MINTPKMRLGGRWIFPAVFFVVVAAWCGVGLAANPLC
jgi:hypothetical protein